MNSSIVERHRTGRRELTAIHPSAWTYTTWRREIHRPLLATAIALTLVAGAVTAVGYALELLPVSIVGAALGALTALWHWYLRLPLSGVTAHRLAPAIDIDNPPENRQVIQPIHGRSGPVAALPTRRETPAELPALTTTTSLTTALEATR